MAIELRLVPQQVEVPKYVAMPGDVLEGEALFFQGYGPNAPVKIDRVVMVISSLDYKGNIEASMKDLNSTSSDGEPKQWNYKTTQEALKNGKFGSYNLRLVVAANAK